jgi:hypothetical protein
MSRSVRYEMRVSPALAAMIDAAAGIASRSRWLEQAAIEKLARDGVTENAAPQPGLVAPDDDGDGPPLQRQDEFPRRPAPRLTGGRKQR